MRSVQKSLATKLEKFSDLVGRRDFWFSLGRICLFLGIVLSLINMKAKKLDK